MFDDDDEFRRGALTMQAWIAVIPLVGEASYGVLAFRSGHTMAASMALIGILVIVTGIAITLRLRYVSDLSHAARFNAYFVTSLAVPPCLLSLYEVVTAESPGEVGRYRADAIEGAITNITLTFVVLGVIFGTLEFAPRRRLVVMGSLDALHLSSPLYVRATSGDGRWLALTITTQVVPVVLGHVLAFSVWRYVIQPYREAAREAAREARETNRQLNAEIERRDAKIEHHRERFEQHDATLSSLRRDPALASLLRDGDETPAGPPSPPSASVPSTGEADSSEERERQTTSASSEQDSLQDDTARVHMAAAIVGLDVGTRGEPRHRSNARARRVI